MSRPQEGDEEEEVVQPAPRLALGVVLSQNGKSLINHIPFGNTWLCYTNNRSS